MKNMKSYIYLALGMSLAGSSVVTGKILVGTMPIFFSQSLSTFIALVCLLPFAWLIEGNPFRWRLKKIDLIYIILQALTGMFLFRIFLLEGLKRTTALEGGIITSVTPAILALLSYFLLKEVMKTNTIMGISLCVLGMILINLNLNPQSLYSEQRLTGNFFIFLAVMGEALFSVWRKKLSFTDKPFSSTTLITFISFLLFLPIGIVQGAHMTLALFTPKVIFALFYYGAFCTALAYICWFSGIAKIKASTAAGFTGFMPITSILLSTFLLGETLELRHVIGTLMTLAGIYVLIGWRGPYSIYVFCKRILSDKTSKLPPFNS